MSVDNVLRKKVFCMLAEKAKLVRNEKASEVKQDEEKKFISSFPAAGCGFSN